LSRPMDSSLSTHPLAALASWRFPSLRGTNLHQASLVLRVAGKTTARARRAACRVAREGAPHPNIAARVGLGSFLAVITACGFPATPPSVGECVGDLDRQTFAYGIDAEESAFHLASGVLSEEHGHFLWSFGEGRLVVRSQWQNMPYAADVGSHVLPVGF